LTGERGHYELAAGRSAKPFLHAMEAFASSTGMLTEQVWDTDDLPESHMYLGKPTGAVMPLMWAHAEYLKLLRSTHDGSVFDLIPAVSQRYLGDRKSCRCLEVWKHKRQCRTVRKGYTLRIQTRDAFRLRWTKDDWQTTLDADSSATRLNVHFADITIVPDQRAPIRFTFFYPQWSRWEGYDYVVRVE
jgi:glucoamylase